MSSLRILLRTLAVAGLSAALIAPASVARAQPTPAELTKQIEKSSTELERIVESYNKLNEEIKANKATAATLQTRIGPLQAQTEQSRAEVGHLAVTAYKTGGLRTAQALLEPGASTSLPERLGALDQLTRQRQATIDGFTENQRTLIDQKTRLDTTLARQAAQAKQLVAGKKKIEADLARLYQLRRQAYGRATEAPTKSTASAPNISGSAGTAVRYAYGAIGKPYVYGADGPSGYDCSGLTLAAWRAAGKSLPHNAAMQWDATARISRGSLKPGDLVFYSGLGHVAIYVGSGQIIDAPSAGRNVNKRGIDIMSIQGYGRVR
ncbi:MULTISPECIES: C40 family peptidase [Micromonospora]|uniref:Glycoside hydrolase n=1 Tax=Micromonospora solifontis TaxID=2487138 RepID=A0ABX9WDS7_9ACTN|nr:MULTISPECIES: C40 family peptidase [Micromonospora]NES16795.1 glycoside hydrolase [Micromonospora sp. PPF5-17B]NES37813.1 glycoside hydrolase [Micromonospora solifontis]NES58567.1 glycoside hydrolase [Micromonospora sp. PPF5-6]RNL97912.1 glycoside hydrolase [Micromonospora solifontis]